MFVFALRPNWGLPKYIKVLTTCFHLKSFFKKQEEVWNWSLYLIFCMIFEEKCFSRYMLLNDQISLPHCLDLSSHFVICLLQFVVQPVTSQILKLIIAFL